MVKAADIHLGTYRDSSDSIDRTSSQTSQQSSDNWTAAQIITPVLIAILLSLSFILYLQYKNGSLSRPLFVASMRGARQTQRPRGWTIDGIRPADSIFLNAEATPMINSRPHWTSLSLHDADRHRLSPRTRETISAIIRSIQRLFGRGPIPVSHVPISDAFDIEDSNPEMDPSDTLRSIASSSRVRRNGPVGRSRDSTADREAPLQNIFQPSEATRYSRILEPEFDDARDTPKPMGADGVRNHETETSTRDGVMLISRNGRDFSLTSSLISRISRTPVERDRMSTEVVPPSPTFYQQPFPFRAHAYHTRSASTPHLHSSLPHAPPLRSFSPSISNMSGRRPPTLPVISPIPIPARPADLRPFGKEAHYYTAATPPIDVSDPKHHRPLLKTAKSSLTLSSTPSPGLERRTAVTTRRHKPASPPPSRSYSPPPSVAVTPHLQDYAPSFPGALYVPPRSVSSTPIPETDPQNLIPSAVRGAGYNPFQHSRSTSDLAFG